jgi:hypothetical protein
MSCTSKSNNNSIENKTKMEISKKEPVILDSVSIMKYTADKLIEQNGVPFSDKRFPIKSIDRSQWVLYNYYSQYSNVEIRELIWEIDLNTNLTIWYVLKLNDWEPITFDFWDKGMEF